MFPFDDVIMIFVSTIPRDVNIQQAMLFYGFPLYSLLMFYRFVRSDEFIAITVVSLMAY